MVVSVGSRNFFSRSSTILHIYDLWWDYFLSSHSQEINKAVFQMLYYLISKNTCQRNNHRCPRFTIKWYVMSNKPSSIVNSTLYIILFIDDDWWIRWTEVWQNFFIVTHHSCLGLLWCNGSLSCTFLHLRYFLYTSCSSRIRT